MNFLCNISGISSLGCSQKPRYPPNTGVNPIYSVSRTEKPSDESEVIVGREN
jgi:hypothetical protein